MTSFTKEQINIAADDAYAQLYEQLPIQQNRIRLLHVNDAANIDEPLVCELGVVDLTAEHPRYVAISYTWGTEAQDKQLQCGGVVIPVTLSCTDILREMRARGETDVWIDQVCINQANLEERSSQVAFMGNIYAKAAVVFVWLGRLRLTGEQSLASLDRDFPSMDDAVAALRAGRLRQITDVEKCGRDNIDYQMLLKRVLAEVESEVNLVELKQITSEMMVFLNLFERSYFERRWVIQEVTCHDDVRVLVGNIELDFDVLFDAALHLRSFYSAVEEDWWLDKLRARMGCKFVDRLWPVDSWMRSVNVDLMQRIRFSRRTGQDLVWHVLHGCTFFRTSDPRDSLYSLRAIWTTQKPPKPDYTLDNDSVAIAHTQWLMKQGYTSLVLESAPLSRLLRKNVPSWSIDFSCAYDLLVDNTVRQDLSYRIDKLYIYLSETSTPGMREYEKQIFYGKDGTELDPNSLFPDAAKCMPSSFSLHAAPKPELHTKAIIIDTIADFLPEDTALDIQNFRSAWEWYRMKRLLQSDQVKRRINTQQEWAEKLQYISLYEHNVVFREKIMYHITGSSKEGQEKPPRIVRGELRTQDNIGQDAGFLTFWDRGAEELSYTIFGHLVFGVTNDGWPVLLPPGVRIGDRVTFICGVKVPFVLRATEDLKYQIVGQAHVMSLMWWWNEIPEAISEKQVRSIVLV